jgi:hypothetical protein
MVTKENQRFLLVYKVMNDIVEFIHIRILHGQLFEYDFQP